MLWVLLDSRNNKKILPCIRAPCRSPVECVEHLDGDEDGQCHGHGSGVGEHGTVHALKASWVPGALQVVRQLVVVQLRGREEVSEIARLFYEDGYP